MQRTVPCPWVAAISNLSADAENMDKKMDIQNRIVVILQKDSSIQNLIVVILKKDSETVEYSKDFIWNQRC